MSEPVPSHHAPGGGFRNPWPGARPWGYLHFLKWVIIDRLAREMASDPDPGVFRRVEPAYATPRATDDVVTVTWVGHSTLLLQLGGLNIITDPIWSERASPVSFAGPRRWVGPGIDFDALPPIDVILQSHNHYDHLDSRTVRRIAERHAGATWLSPLGVGSLQRSWGARNVVELDWWEDRTIDGVRFACSPTQHQSARTLRDRGRTLWCSWSMLAGDRRVYFGGDSAYHPAFAEIGERYGPFDLALLPIGAYEPRWFMRVVHMNPEEAVRAFLDLHERHTANPAAAMVPIHWGTFKLTDEAMDDPPRRIRKAWRDAGLPDDRLWLLAHGETRTLLADRAPERRAASAISDR
ncbi:MAG: MBL fold metallo-hydrolase [Gemmatimonadaceae bacterium]